MNSIVIAGSSRAQLGLDPSVMDACIPQRNIKHLTIDGTQAFAVVRDLCEDERFTGVILWSATASALYPAPDQRRGDEARVAFFHNKFGRGQDFEKNINCYISAFLQGRFAVLSQQLSLKPLLRSGFRPSVSYINLQSNRYRPARYYGVMSEEERADHRRKRVARRAGGSDRKLDMQEFQRFLRVELTPLYDRLLTRGGGLVILRMPTTDEHWEMDNRQVPKELFWDRIEPLTGIPTIHFLDYAELGRFNCPDTSHLDVNDAPAFTMALSQILKKRLPPGDGVAQ